MATKKTKKTMPTSKRRNSKGRVATAKKKTKSTQPKRVVKAKAAKKPPAKKALKKKTKARSVGKKKPSVSTQRELNQDIRSRTLGPTGTKAVRQSSDLQGLSRVEQADSESVDELVDEGNLFEAGAVAGVEEADSEDEREVHTHEMPEDDVPDEYLDDK